MKPGTPGFLGKRLREAREARELTMQKLADSLDLTRQSISRYEKDQQSPHPDILEKISERLELPTAYFLENRAHDFLDSSRPKFYRKLSAATKRIRAKAERRYEWMQDISSFLGDFIEFPDTNFPDFNPPSDPHKISSELIEELASNTRRFWGLGDGPISNIVWLLENNGVIVGRYSFDSSELDAFSQDLVIKERDTGTLQSRPHVVLGDSKKSAVRGRATSAHELGHLVLHRNIEENIFRDSKYHKLIEAQANRFAGAFLFPRDVFLREVPYVSLEHFKSLKMRWKVSIALMIQRAWDLGVIEDSERKRLFVNISRRKWRTCEPFDDEILAEEPKLLKGALEMLVEEKIQTKKQILKALNLSHRDIEDIIGLPRDYLREVVIDFNSPLNLRRRNKFNVKPSDTRKNGDGKIISFPLNQDLEN